MPYAGDHTTWFIYVYVYYLYVYYLYVYVVYCVSCVYYLTMSIMREPIKVYVAVQRPPFLVYTYTYHKAITPGIRVHVPYGMQSIVGVVVDKPRAEFCPRGQTKMDNTIKLKPIRQVLDITPIYSPTMLDLAQFMAYYYIHPLGDVLRTMLPLGSMTTARWVYVCSQTILPPPSSHYAQTLTKIYPTKKKSLSQSTFHKKFLKICKDQSIESPASFLKQLMSNGYLSLECMPRTFRKNNPTEHQTENSQDHQICQWNDLDQLGTKAAKITTDRIHIIEQRLKPLNKDQSQVYLNICKSLCLTRTQGFQSPWLLHGVTGSGKTEIYRHLILEMLRADHHSQALIMVPEISLTPQISAIFSHAFGDLVTVIHSAMPPSTRWQVLEAVRNEKKRILIGPRSSIFAPFFRLKLIIVDEEHDSSYKQGTGFLYQARDMAIMRAKLENASVILGSATPSLESYHHAITQKYQLASLPKRALGTALPLSQLEYTTSSSTKGEYIRHLEDLKSIPQHNTMISENILDALRENLAKGKQAMVVVHRRGFAHYLMDMSTQATISCPHCSISMSVHLESKKLLCHYCDYNQHLDDVLKNHTNTTLVAVGYGSEKAYDLIKYHLPKARCARIDSDISKKTSNTLTSILQAFKEQQIDILIGTQMIAKGHDFPNVALTALLEVDEILRLADFRAGERAFQLIVQASGRSGRGSTQGKVFIQTSRPHHPIIQEGLSQNYQRFFKREQKFRSLFSYPPFSKIVLFTLSHESEEKIESISHIFLKRKDQLLKYAKNTQSIKILGPATPQLAKINNQQRRNIVISSKNITQLINFCYELKYWFEHQKENVHIRIDVDPIQMI